LRHMVDANATHRVLLIMTIHAIVLKKRDGFDTSTLFVIFRLRESARICHEQPAKQSEFQYSYKHFLLLGISTLVGLLAGREMSNP